VVTKLQVAEYMRDVALHAALGPYGLPLVGTQVFVSAYEGDRSGVARGVAVGAGSVGMSYAMLQFLNAIQGPKYAMKYHELHRILNPARNLVVGSALANPMVLGAGGIALGTALYPEVSGRTYQGKMAGQPTIGRAGHDLIYNPERIKLRW
jgi:hypothetical protein